MREAGFDNGLDVPLTLRQDIANQANRDYFIDGSVSRKGQELTVTARVWETESLEMLEEISARGWDLMVLVDDLSDGVRELLDTPTGQGDLPLVETYGESQNALQSYVQARNAVLFDNDREQANRLFDLALEYDPNFVLAWYLKSTTLWQQGNAIGAGKALEETQKLAYRLPERDRIAVKLMAYRIAGEQEKVETLLRMQTQIVGDAASFNTLAHFLMMVGELEDAREQLKMQMAVDSTSFAALLQLARLERSLGDMDAALAYALEYVEAEPDDLSPLILLGDLYLETGDMDSACSYYERAQVIEDPPISSTLKLALLSIKQGEWKQTRTLIAEGRALAASARQAIQVLQVEALLETRLGRIERAMELTEEQRAYAEQALAPVEQVFTYNLPLIDFNIQLGRLEQAESILLTAQQALQPPLNQFLAFSEVVLFARKGDITRASAALDAGIAVIEHFKIDYLAFMVPMAEAEIAKARGEYSEAGRLYGETMEKANRSVMAGGLQDNQSTIFGASARAHVRAGELDIAQGVIDQAFKRDGAEPGLWLARAMLQEANGAKHMALASVNYALAIWSEADPDYIHMREALDLQQRLEAAPD